MQNPYAEPEYRLNRKLGVIKRLILDPALELDEKIKFALDTGISRKQLRAFWVALLSEILDGRPVRKRGPGRPRGAISTTHTGRDYVAVLATDGNVIYRKQTGKKRVPRTVYEAITRHAIKLVKNDYPHHNYDFPERFPRIAPEKVRAARRRYRNQMEAFVDDLICSTEPPSNH